MKIAVTGHRPDAFLVSHYTIDTVKSITESIVVAHKREHQDLTFLLGGTIGIDQWVGEACIKHEVKFKLFLPFQPVIQAKYWTDEQKAELDRQCKHAKGLYVIDPVGPYNVWTNMERNKKMVDESDLVIAFWVGKRRGGTYNAIQYALRKEKTVLNALNELKLISKQELKTGWTPPTVMR